MECFVVVDKENKITDMFSFYNLPSTISGHTQFKELKAAYAYYMVPGKLSMKELVKTCLITAKQKNYDVFNMLDIMDNTEVFEDLLFVKGDGFLNYYLYNWNINSKVMHPKEIGVVLM